MLVSRSVLQFDSLVAELCPVLDPVLTISVCKFSSGTAFGDSGFLAQQQNRCGHMDFDIALAMIFVGSQYDPNRT